MFHCFVVCPFGSDSRGDEEKALLEQITGLRKHVFKAAASAAKRKGYDVEIADSRQFKHGRAHIQDAVQKSIDEADAVIVILTADKPNVYLELGWAQGLWQAPILLKRVGYDAPADISNDLCLEFKPGHVDGSDKAGIKQLAGELADKIIEKIKLGRTEKQFKHWPDETLARGAVHVYNRFSKAVTMLQWSKMLEAAEHEIILASTSLSRILKQEFYRIVTSGEPIPVRLDQLLLDKAIDGVAVTIMLYHDDNLTEGHLTTRERDDFEEVQKELRKSTEAWSTQRLNFETTARRNSNITGSFRVIQIQRRHLPFRVTLTEKRVLATLRLYSETFNSGMTIDALRPRGEADPNKGKAVYTQIRDELDHIIRENSEASEQTYRDWVERRRRA